jgi:RNA-directed DNA polymerase
MGIRVPELRFLTFQRVVSEVSHYQRFRIPKKTGGERLIAAPMPRLKRAQYWVQANL